MMGSQSEESMNDTLQKASLISEQKQTRSRPNSSLIPRHTVQSPASMPLPSALPSRAALPGRQRFGEDGRKWSCKPGLGHALPMCYFGPGYVVKLAW